MSEATSVERPTLDPRSPWWGEHRSRYHFAATRVRGRIALDVGCGTGFGTRLLADAGAALVVGADVRWRAIKETRSHDRHGDDRFWFVQADGIALPFRDDSVEVIASFETLEHVGDDRAFLGEIARVLKDDGVALISTPNSSMSPGSNSRPTNPSHVREYTIDQLARLLQGFFSSVEIRGQRVAPYYPVCPLWQQDEVFSRSPLRRAQVIWWRVQNRLPFQIKERLSRLLHNRSFFPGEYDFVFETNDIEDAHVLVAECTL